MIDKFCSLFRFDKEKAMFVGVERERFIVNRNGAIVPLSKQVLDLLPKDNTYGYELSATQLEDRVGPIHLGRLTEFLEKNDRQIRIALDALNLSDLFLEVAPYDMDLTVFDDPTGRYQRIVKNMPTEILRAACRVAGTHVHVGMPDFETALSVYNKVIKNWEPLCDLINHSNGERIKIYKEMAPDFKPKEYSTIEEFYSDAVVRGFDQDPRKNWQLIRVTVHGTIEFRMGGATSSHEEIVRFATACHNSCATAYYPLVTQSV